MLSTQPDPHPPLHTIKYILLYYSHREGGRGRGEPVRRLEGLYSSQEGFEIPTWLTVSPVYKLYSTHVKTRFRVWCLIVLWSMETNNKYSSAA
jgi:hypothetical protein